MLRWWRSALRASCIMHQMASSGMYSLSSLGIKLPTAMGLISPLNIIPSWLSGRVYRVQGWGLGFESHRGQVFWVLLGGFPGKTHENTTKNRWPSPESNQGPPAPQPDVLPLNHSARWTMALSFRIYEWYIIHRYEWCTHSYLWMIYPFVDTNENAIIMDNQSLYHS